MDRPVSAVTCPGSQGRRAGTPARVCQHSWCLSLCDPVVGRRGRDAPPGVCQPKGGCRLCPSAECRGVLGVVEGRQVGCSLMLEVHSLVGLPEV